MAFQGDSIYWVEVEKVVPNPFQPRREFDQNKLQELADSIRMYGVLQPLTVTRKEVQKEDGTFYTEYELIAGERRLQASKLAGTAQVPVIIREGEESEQEKLEIAIIENLQREDLSAVDRALAFKQLAEVFGLSHAQVAKKVGRSREYVSNSIRLLGLPPHMLESLRRLEMMEGHARTLLMLNDRPEEQEVVYKEILLKKLSVREVERIVRKIATDKVRKKKFGEFDANLIEFEKQFTESLGTRVQIQKTDFGGKLTIDYFSEEDLEVILKRIKDEVSEKEPTQHEVVERLAQHTPLAVSAQPEIVQPAPEANLPQPQPQPQQPFQSPERTIIPEKTIEPESQVKDFESENTLGILPSEPKVLSYIEPVVPIELVKPVEPAEPIEPIAQFESFIPQPVVKETIEDTPVPEKIFENTYDYGHPNASQQPAEKPPVETVQSIESNKVQAPDENKDESGLYSIRNFSV